MSSSGQLEITPDHLNLASNHICYVHCNFCDTFLAVNVPTNSLFKTVAVRCGHCSYLLSVNMLALLLPTTSSPPLPPPPPPPDQLRHLSPTSFFPSSTHMGENIGDSTSSLLFNNHQEPVFSNHPMIHNKQPIDHRRASPVNRPTEKKQRVPSAYNRFIKAEIQRIKAVNPEISHREAFSAAAKNWAHFPHMNFGLLPDRQPAMKANVRYQQQEGEHNVKTMKEGMFLTPTTNVNVGGICHIPY